MLKALLPCPVIRSLGNSRSQRQSPTSLGRASCGCQYSVADKGLATREVGQLRADRGRWLEKPQHGFGSWGPDPRLASKSYGWLKACSLSCVLAQVVVAVAGFGDWDWQTGTPYIVAPTSRTRRTSRTSANLLGARLLLVAGCRWGSRDVLHPRSMMKCNVTE